MPRIFPIIRKVIVQGGGGNVPPGAAVMVDDYRMAVTVFTDDTNAAQADTMLSALSVTYAESSSTPTDAFRLGLFQSDVNAQLADSVLTALNVTFGETNLTPADTFLLGLSNAEQLGALLETLRLGITQEDLIAVQLEALRLGLTQTDLNASVADASTQAIFVSYAELVGAQSEALRVALAGLDETNLAAVEVVKINLGMGDSSLAQSDLLRVALLGFAETNPIPSELLKTGFSGSGLAEASNAPSDTRSATTFTYATTQVSVGNGATNGANATGQNNGTLANITTATLGDATCSVTPKIPRASVPNAGTLTLFAWYKTVAGATSTFTLTYTDTGGNPVNITLPAGDFLITPRTETITSLHATNDITVLFQLTDAAAGVNPGVLTVDAIAIRSVGAF